MNRAPKKPSSVPHYNPIRVIIGNYKCKDAKFLSVNEKVLNKLLHIFSKKA